ncbi:MAG: hypothetical protein IT346_00550 [Epsilonproteobacteria bacterium]|nr:hypothetical protein [Campylobacterota bacterium]
MKRILLQGLIVSCLCLPVIGQASDGENSAVDPRMQAHKEYMAARRAAQQASGKQATIEMLSKGNQSYCIYTDPAVVRAREAVSNDPSGNLVAFDEAVRKAEGPWGRLNTGTGNKKAALKEIASWLPWLK